jgi:4-hydroxy-tetrahydrodipicolinate reductase
MKPKLIITGSAGRMGKRLIALAIESGRFDLLAAIEKDNHPDIGSDAGLLASAGSLGVKISNKYSAGADVVIDFSQPQALNATLKYCLENNSALVLGTTGLNDRQQDEIKKASQQIPLVYSTNMSVGMNVLFSTVGKFSQLLGDDYDIEIVEQHHRFKKDAPSGSALTLARNICESTGRDFKKSVIFGREGKEALRHTGQIAIHAVRAGDITGIHSVIFSTLGETVSVNHTAHTRDCFAKGALRAAEWIVGKKPSLYTMIDVLSLAQI